MITFIIGLIILVFGGLLYGKLCERVIRPTDNPTPATRMNDGVDYVPMKKWRNSLIELLNIAGTGPILGPIQGVLFGPIAFITIPIGCVLAGAVHDYMVGMLSIRNDGAQMPVMVKKFLGKHIHPIYNIFVALTLLLVGVVFIYTPGDLFVTQIIGQDSSISNPVVWIVYGAIFVYYIIATLFPIDKIIGKVYPVFGAVLILSAIGVFIGIFAKGYPLNELWETGVVGVHPLGQRFIPIFFVTVACGITSGFHSTQATLISRTVTHEKEGRMTFYNMMIAEGIIAMIWAAAAMGVYNLGLADAHTLNDSSTKVVGIVSKDILGSIGGLAAIIGVIVLPITSGDTTLRSLRLIVSDALNVDNTKKMNKLLVAVSIFTVAAGVLIFSKANTSGFNILWRYFAWANQTLAVFSFAVITMYMIKHKMPYIIALAPGMFYMFVISSFILNAQIGFNLPWTVSYILGGIIALAFGAALVLCGKRYRSDKAYRLNS
ncbi:MAG: carbon starvation protein A [Clostridia bacterium]|nr:carbon starvation protein A [Clostridia bacterium]